MSLPSNPDTQVYISVDGSGAFTGTLDRVTPYVHHERGLEVSEGRDGAQQLNPPRIGAGGFDLKNESGRFSPDFSGSPYYQQLLPVRPVQYVANYGESRLYREPGLKYRAHVPYRGIAPYKLGRHVIDDFSQSDELGRKRLSINTISYETLLTRTTVTVAMLSNVRVSTCFTALLDAAGWPADKRSIAVSDTTLLYWWCDERSPWEAMLELLISEGPGTFYVSGDGVFHFENRNYRTTATRSQISQATLQSVGGIQDLTFQSYTPGNFFRSIYNRATYTTKRRTLGILQKVYEYGATLTLTAGQTKTLYVRPTDPFQEAVSPVAATDYTVTSGSASVSLTYSSGFLAIITIVAGGSGAVIDGVTSTGIQLRAKPLTVLSETTVVNTVDASVSIARFSPVPGANVPITYTVSGWPEIDPAEAEAVCNAWVLTYQYPRIQGTITIENGNDLALEQCLRRLPSDRVTLVRTNPDVTVDVWINARSLRIAGAAGRLVEATFAIEQCDTLSGGVWDSAIWDNVAAIWGV